MEQENYGQEQETELLNEDQMPVEETDIEFSEELSMDEVAVEDELEEETSDSAMCEPKKEEKKAPALWQMIIAGIGSAILLIGLALLLLYGLGFEIVPKAEAPAADSQGSSEPESAVDTPAFVPNKVYTADEDVYTSNTDQVVATVNGKNLTNGKLQVYYGVVVNDFVMNYYSYLSTIGLDYTKPLSEQECYFEEGISWEEYFVKTAVDTWVNYQSIMLLAEESGYEMPAEIKEAVDQIVPQLEKQAKEMEYESAEALVKDRMHCTVEEYAEYWTFYQIGADFTSKKPAREELEKYFEENKETLEASGITKDSGLIVDVRHILVMPKGGTTDENGNTTYSEDEWKTCKETAEQIYADWKKGEATEDSFAALANEKSEDGGSNTNGGLYEGVTKETQFVEPFLEWCMDETHKVGDTGIVKTDYGYHIMYLSTTEEYWVYETTMSYISEKTAEMIETAKEKWPAQIDLEKACLMAVQFA